MKGGKYIFKMFIAFFLKILFKFSIIFLKISFSDLNHKTIHLQAEWYSG